MVREMSEGDTPYTYELEELENHRVPGADVEEPSHLLRCTGTDRDGSWGDSRYYVDVDGDELRFVMERAGSSRTYEKHTMFPPRYRALLEADGYTVIDPAEHIRPGTTDEVLEWLADQDVDPVGVTVRVSPRFRSVTISPDGFLEGEAWETFIQVMRAHDVIQWAETQEVHYVADADLPTLLEDETDA